MLSYLAFIHHGIESAGEPLNDGKTLAQNCVNKLQALNDPEQFPPRLLFLLASPAYLDSLKAEQLLNGVFQIFDEAGYRDVELMGCSVAAVFFNRRIHHEGALLVCLASRLLEAKVKASSDVSLDHEKAVNSLLLELGLTTKEGKEVHSFVNRTLFALLPSFGGDKYLAPQLHESLRTKLKGLSIFGGVASADDTQRIRPGLLFANREIYRKAIVAASVECGTPLGISLTRGLTDTGHVFNVAELDPQNNWIIQQFRQGKASDVMQQIRKISPMPVFASLALDRDPIVEMPALNGEAVRLNREILKDEIFHLLTPKPAEMQEAFRDGIKKSLESAFLLNPIAGLGFRCTGLLRHSKLIGLDLEYETALIESDLSRAYNPYEKPFVGGFLDGEAGIDKNGKSVLGNWSNATLIFGDELRFRTPVYRGFEKLAEFAGQGAAENYKKGIDGLTQLIYDIGFPGAMLSLRVNDEEREAIVAQSASGSRFRIPDEVNPYTLGGDDILTIVAREKRKQLILDSRKVKCSSMVAASKAGIISQYIMPLIGINDKVNSVLQIDLGDISYDTQLYPTEITVLESLGKIVNSGLNRILDQEKSRINSKLDQTMNACLSADTIKQGLQRFLEQALEAFELKEGHIRIAEEDQHCLRLVAGVGDYFEESRKKRSKIDFDDLSPTAQAFRDEKIIIIDDAKHNESHQEMCRLWEQEEALCHRLREAGSYANIPFKSERGERGTINLVSRKAWFFKSFHNGVLKALGERAGFLLETLRRKERESFRKERESFLLGISPQFSQIRNLDDVAKVLANGVGRFANAVRAEVASLYLWDEDRDRYILRAQHGWAKPEWINAAYYTQKEFWAGTTALAGKPHHINNLFDYYEKHPKSIRRYTASAFGQELSPDFTVEAIGLRLMIADNRLGVLTFYRPIKPGDESGFVTTDTELLQQGADNFASLISILQANRREKWRKQEHTRRQEVYDATITAKDPEPFEARVCQQALKSYGAIKASFYKVEFIGETPQFVFKKGFRRNPKTDQPIESAMSLQETELVERTMNTNRYNEKEMLTDQVKIERDEEQDYKRVALAELVKRACIPLFSEKKLVGILDLHWSFDYKQADSLGYQHGGGFLRMLGEVVGSAYGKHQTKVQAEDKLEEAEAKLFRGKGEFLQSVRRTRKVVQVTSAYVLQHHHELRTIITELHSLLVSLEAIRRDAAGEEAEILKALSDEIQKGSATLESMIEIGRRMSRPAYETLRLKDLILSALEESQSTYAKLNIEVNTPDIPETYWSSVDPYLIKIAFANLLNNAMKFMRDRKRRVLDIRATEIDGQREVTITIKDTGIGMNNETIRLILREFFSVNNRISVGVTIANMILGLHGGRLNYSSVKGAGTETIITLPLDNVE
jgi:signal transduction histidine kinase